MPKNDYFTFTADGQHRTANQVWNFNGKRIWVQGGNGEIFGNRVTSFAKKHLLTFAGGKGGQPGKTLVAKMKKIRTRRREVFAPDDPKRAKYGGQVWGKNTFICCDEFEADDLQEAFSLGIDATIGGGGNGEHVGTLRLRGNEVRQLKASGAVGFVARADAEVNIDFIYLKRGSAYLVMHLDAVRTV